MRSSIGAGYDVPSSVVVQADGKIVIGGRSHNGSNKDMALVRYKADGTFDSSFDGDEKLFLDFGGNDYLNDVVIQSDGAFVVTGSIGGHLAVGRIQPDGTPDSGFGTAGFVTTVIQLNSGGNGVVLQSDGNIVVAGTVNNGNGNEFTNRDFLIARYGGANPITNVAPSGLVLNSGNISGNDTFTLEGSFDAPGSLDVHTVTVNWGDGATETHVLPVGARSFSFDHQYLDNPADTSSGQFPVSVTVSDDDAGCTDSYSPEVLSDSPVGYWQLNEAAGATSFVDSSGYGNTGASSGNRSPDIRRRRRGLPRLNHKRGD